VGGYGCKVEIAIWLLDYGIYFEGELFFIVLEFSINSGPLYTRVEGPLTMSLNPCLGLPLGLHDDKDYLCGLHFQCSSLQNGKQPTHMETKTK
jgi:hypothetical protein